LKKGLTNSSTGKTPKRKINECYSIAPSVLIRLYSRALREHQHFEGQEAGVYLPVMDIYEAEHHRRSKKTTRSIYSTPEGGKVVWRHMQKSVHPNMK
jgi:hypothetical protein